MKLFEISDQIEAILLAGTDMETGEITDEALQAISDLEEDLAAKALDVAAYIKGELAEAEAVKTQATRLADRAKIHERRAERLTDYLAWHIKGQKMSDGRVSIGWRPSSAVVIGNESTLPTGLCRYQPSEWKPDKKRIKEAIEKGEIVPGAHLVKRQNIQIK